MSAKLILDFFHRRTTVSYSELILCSGLHHREPQWGHLKFISLLSSQPEPRNKHAARCLVIIREAKGIWLRMNLSYSHSSAFTLSLINNHKKQPQNPDHSQMTERTSIYLPVQCVHVWTEPGCEFIFLNFWSIIWLRRLYRLKRLLSGRHPSLNLEKTVFIHQSILLPHQNQSFPRWARGPAAKPCVCCIRITHYMGKDVE